MFQHRLDVILEAEDQTRRDFIKSSAAAVSAAAVPGGSSGIAKTLSGLASLKALANRAWLNSSAFKRLSRFSKSTRKAMCSNHIFTLNRSDASKLSPDDLKALESAVRWHLLNRDGDLDASVDSTDMMWAFEASGAHSFMDLLIKEAGGGKQFLRIFCKDILGFVDKYYSEDSDNSPHDDYNPTYLYSESIGYLISCLKKNPSLGSLLGGFDGERIFRDPKLSLWQAESKFMDLMHKHGVIDDAEYHDISKMIKANSMDPRLVAHDAARRKELQEYHDYWDSKKRKQREEDEQKRKTAKKESESFDRNAISRWEDEGGASSKDLEESINNLLSIII